LSFLRKVENQYASINVWYWTLLLGRNTDVGFSLFFFFKKMDQASRAKLAIKLGIAAFEAGRAHLDLMFLAFIGRLSAFICTTTCHGTSFRLNPEDREYPGPNKLQILSASI
jgi:hypothetical protein